MPELRLPEGWVYFAGLPDLALALVGILLITLLIIWWRQQTRLWFRVVMATFLAALLLCIGSYYLFVVPPYFASCPSGCTGWRGFPLRFALIDLNGVSRVAVLDFLLNLLMLWLLWLGASVVWRLAALALRWENRSWRFKLLFIVLLVILPWAFLPRVLDPPQPPAVGEDLRLAVNAERSAEFTYRITGFWLQRLALEDIRRGAPIANPESLFGETVVNEVCLRGYTYFYLPWRRYRITLDPSGVTALNLAEVPLQGSCWEAQ
ncbi:MAG TPA: hypothetical protein VNK95_16830 [Caldilineaceae bacterium]|nr:hypothetical protein [Caldilineaceae bacterium]